MSTSRSGAPLNSQPAAAAATAAPKDPFADLTAGLGSGWLPTSTTAAPNVKPTSSANSNLTSPLSTQFSSPTHGTHPSPRPGSTPTHGTPPTRSPANEPTAFGRAAGSAPTAGTAADYSRSHFDSGVNGNKAKASGGGVGAAVTAGGGGLGGDIFGDILGQQGYSFASNKSTFSPRSINEMRKEELVRDMDPDKLKIMEWVSGLD